nr:hypothetical protein [Candidatus Sigynarchaeota archaeon]
MGLYDDKKDLLGTSFSFRQFCEACHYTDSESKEARNQLKMLARRGYIKRVSKNNYLKIKA